MTQPVNQSMLKAEMETLAKVYVILQAAAIDSLIACSDKLGEWRGICQLSLSASDHIFEAVDKMVNAYHELRHVP